MKECAQCFSSFLFSTPPLISLTNTCVHCGRPPLSEIFSQHIRECLIIKKERLHRARALICSTGRYLMNTQVAKVWTDTRTCCQDKKICESMRYMWTPVKGNRTHGGFNNPPYNIHDWHQCHLQWAFHPSSVNCPPWKGLNGCWSPPHRSQRQG